MTFILSSEKLKEDGRMIKPMDSQWEKIKCLENLGRRYGFGHSHNTSDSHTTYDGVVRNEINASPGRKVYVRI